jgi:hypothetical protein
MSPLSQEIAHNQAQAPCHLSEGPLGYWQILLQLPNHASLRLAYSSLP